MSENHNGLQRRGLFIPNEDIHWIREDFVLNNNEHIDYLLRIRYRQPLVKATLYKEPEGLFIIFEEPIKAIAAGQFAAWYLDNELIGSGVIS